MLRMTLIGNGVKAVFQSAGFSKRAEYLLFVGKGMEGKGREGKERKEGNERKGKQWKGKERRREKRRDREGWYIGKEEELRRKVLVIKYLTRNGKEIWMQKRLRRYSTLRPF